MAADAAPRAPAPAGEDARRGVVRRAAGYDGRSTATGASARASSTWSPATRRHRRVLRGEDPPGRRVRHARSRRSPPGSSSASGCSRAAGSSDSDVARRRRCASTSRRSCPDGTGGWDGRRARSRVLDRRSGAGAVAAQRRRRRCSRCQQPVCQCRRASGSCAAAPRPRGPRRRGSRGRSPGSGTASPPGTAGRAGRRRRRRGPEPSSHRSSCRATGARSSGEHGPQRRAPRRSANASTTMKMSLRRVARLPNGLKPTAATVGAEVLDAHSWLIIWAFTHLGHQRPRRRSMRPVASSRRSAPARRSTESPVRPDELIDARGFAREDARARAPRRDRAVPGAAAATSCRRVAVPELDEDVAGSSSITAPSLMSALQPTAAALRREPGSREHGAAVVVGVTGGDRGAARCRRLHHDARRRPTRR